MKTYEMRIADDYTTTYIRGQISGMIFVLTDMPADYSGFAKKNFTDDDWDLRYMASEEQQSAILDCLYRKYPEAIVGVKEVE